MVLYDNDCFNVCTTKPRITVLGIGGAGGNMLNAVVNANITNINCIALNTDVQALEHVAVDNKIYLGLQTTRGMGTGANPEVGKIAAEEDAQKIEECIQGSDIVFLLAGLGGGTGTGAIPVIARMLQEKGILSIVLVTKPFMFEGNRRMNIAQSALQKIEEYADTLIVIPNQKLFETNQAAQDMPLVDAFEKVNLVVCDCIKAVSNTIYNAGNVNVDFADIKTTMTRMGKAVIGIGKANGSQRAKQSIENAINSPLLEHTSLRGARSILLNINGNRSLTLQEMNIIAGYVHDQAHQDAHIILGSSINNEDHDEVTVTIIATGFEDQLKARASARYSNQFTSSNNYQQFPQANINSYSKSTYNQQQQNISSQNNKNIHPGYQQQSYQNTSQIHQTYLDIPTFLRKNNQNIIDNENE